MQNSTHTEFPNKLMLICWLQLVNDISESQSKATEN